jgi:hypothetical protein
MKPPIFKRRTFLSTLMAVAAGGFGFRALFRKTLSRVEAENQSASTITIEPHPSAVPRKRPRTHGA